MIVMEGEHISVTLAPKIDLPREMGVDNASNDGDVSIKRHITF